jgi:hypothetical protein
VHSDLEESLKGTSGRL